MSEYINMFRVVKAMPLFIRVQLSVFLFLHNFVAVRGDPATAQECWILITMTSTFWALIPGDLQRNDRK